MHGELFTLVWYAMRYLQSLEHEKSFISMAYVSVCIEELGGSAESEVADDELAVTQVVGVTDAADLELLGVAEVVNHGDGGVEDDDLEEVLGVVVEPAEDGADGTAVADERDVLEPVCVALVDRLGDPAGQTLRELVDVLAEVAEGAAAVLVSVLLRGREVHALDDTHVALPQRGGQHHWDVGFALRLLDRGQRLLAPLQVTRKHSVEVDPLLVQVAAKHGALLRTFLVYGGVLVALQDLLHIVGRLPVPDDEDPQHVAVVVRAVVLALGVLVCAGHGQGDGWEGLCSCVCV